MSTHRPLQSEQGGWRDLESTCSTATSLAPPTTPLASLALFASTCYRAQRVQALGFAIANPSTNPPRLFLPCSRPPNLTCAYVPSPVQVDESGSGVYQDHFQ